MRQRLGLLSNNPECGGRECRKETGKQMAVAPSRSGNRFFVLSLHRSSHTWVRGKLQVKPGRMGAKCRGAVGGCARSWATRFIHIVTFAPGSNCEMGVRVSSNLQWESQGSERLRDLKNLSELFLHLCFQGTADLRSELCFLQALDLTVRSPAPTLCPDPIAPSRTLSTGRLTSCIAQGRQSLGPVSSPWPTGCYSPFTRHTPC